MSDPFHLRRPELDTSWMVDAECRKLRLPAEVRAALFFPVKGENGENLDAARAVCARCPVRDDCLAFAVDNNEMFGLWGGLSTKQRRAARKRRLADGQPRVPIRHGMAISQYRRCSAEAAGPCDVCRRWYSAYRREQRAG